MAKIVPLRLTAPRALKMIREIAADTNNIVVIGHATKRRKQRKFTRRQIELCVQRGTITEGPFLNPLGNWQVNLYTCGGRGNDVRGGDRVAEETHRGHGVLRGQKEMAYHYVESGLDNIWLDNGYTEHETPYGHGLSIQDTEGLHKAIGRWLIALPKPLNGAELRFIRLEMELTQRDLGGILGAEEQSIRRWEKAKRRSINGSADRLLRVLYKEYLDGDGSVRQMVDRLATLNEVEPSSVRFCETDSGWQPFGCEEAA